MHTHPHSGSFTFDVPSPSADAMERVACLQTAVCRWKGREVPAVMVSHELAHISSCFPFLGSMPVIQVATPTLFVHFDGAASEGNMSAWVYSPLEQRLQLLECTWELSLLSKLFNDNGLVFAILNLDKAQHLSAPGKLMGDHHTHTHNTNTHTHTKHAP